MGWVYWYCICYDDCLKWMTLVPGKCLKVAWWRSRIKLFWGDCFVMFFLVYEINRHIMVNFSINWWFVALNFKAWYLLRWLPKEDYLVPHWHKSLCVKAWASRFACINPLRKGKWKNQSWVTKGLFGTIFVLFPILC